LSTVFFACPSSTFLALEAKFSDDKVSTTLVWAGDTWQIIRVLASPPEGEDLRSITLHATPKTPFFLSLYMSKNSEYIKDASLHLPESINFMA
jgi:hypothetical protein